MISKSLAAAAALLAMGAAQATISVTAPNFTYSQSFDSLASTGATNAWLNDSTLAGWSLFNRSNAAISALAAGDGSVNTGSFYSFGTTGSADRALGGTASGGAYFGSPASGTVAGYIAVAFTNNTGAALQGMNLSFNGEQWRNGGNTTAQTMALQYGVGATFASVGTWTAPGGNFDWTSPAATGTAAAVNGNTAGLVAGKGGSLALNWAAGDTVWVRWVENNDVANDHSLAIDSLEMSVVAVPEPETYALMALGLLAIGLRLRGRAHG